MSLACLGSLRRSRGATWRLYLVDNASTDDSLEQLADLGADVVLLRSSVNGGWTGGNNLGVRRALDDGFEHIFILNNDALVEPDTLATLLDLFRTRGTRPVLGPVQLDHDGRTPEFVGAEIEAATGLPRITRVQEVVLDDLPAIYPTAFVKGAALFAHRDHFERAGLFDADFYLNYDDTDWCFRVRAAGFEMLMTTTARVVHAGSGSIGGALSPLNIYFLARNELLFAERHCGLRQRPAQLVSYQKLSSRIPQYPTRTRRAVALLFGRHATARAWRAGVRDYLLRRFGDCPRAIRQMSGSR